MTRQRFFVLASAVLWATVLALVVKTSVDRVSAPPWGNQTGGSGVLELQGGTRVGQQFTAPLPGLYRIDVMMDRAATETEQQVTLHLKSDPSAADDLWSSSIHAGDLENGTLYPAEFAPMRDSKGRSYYFYLESVNSGPGSAPVVRYSPDATLENAGAYVNERPVAGDLQFYTHYTLRTRDKVDLLLTRLAAGRPYWLGSKGFYVGLAGVYLLLLLAFLWHAAKAVLGRGP
jgi:hypothetical protein